MLYSVVFAIIFVTQYRLLLHHLIVSAITLPYFYDRSVGFVFWSVRAYENRESETMHSAYIQDYKAEKGLWPPPGFGSKLDLV